MARFWAGKRRKTSGQGDFGELTIHTRELGPGRSDSATAYYLPAARELFAGDIVCRRCHLFFLADGSRIQLRTLEHLPSLYPAVTTVHAGHGESSTLAKATQDQVFYTRTVRAMVFEALSTRSQSTAAEIQTVADRIKARYPELLFAAGQPNLLELNVASLAKDLIEERVAFVPLAQHSGRRC